MKKCIRENLEQLCELKILDTRSCSDEENESMQNLAEEDLPDDIIESIGFGKRKFSRIDSEGLSDQQLRMMILTKQTKIQNTIMNCLIFITFLIGVIVGIKLTILVLSSM